jgi:hypothetical protein
MDRGLGLQIFVGDPVVEFLEADSLAGGDAPRQRQGDADQRDKE